MKNWRKQRKKIKIGQQDNGPTTTKNEDDDDDDESKLSNSLHYSKEMFR